MPDDFTATGYKPGSGQALGFKGSQAGQDAKFSDQEAEAERQRYRKEKGFSGIAGVARMKQPDRDAENTYMTNWRKNKAQKAVVAAPVKDTDKDNDAKKDIDKDQM